MEYMYKSSMGEGKKDRGVDGTPYTGSTLLGEGESPEIDGVEVGGRLRPGEKTRVGRKAVGGGGVRGRGVGQGLGLEREEVSELPGEDIPRAQQEPGQLDGVGVDKWRAYEIAAAQGRRG